MKRTKQREYGHELDGKVRDGKRLDEGDLAQVAGGDVYLHNPRGSNDGLGGG
jgi:hypothetical protein